MAQIFMILGQNGPNLGVVALLFSTFSISFKISQKKKKKKKNAVFSV